MKLITSFVLLIIIGIISCIPEDQAKNMLKDINQSSVLSKAECIKKVLYYKLQSENQESYDSISVQFFHEVKDYTDTVALRMQNEVWSNTSLLNTYVTDTSTYAQELCRKCISNNDSLRKELRHFQLSVTGFVFVHTFAINNDTISMIFLMDKDCNKSDAITVKTVTNDIDPDNFRNNIQNLKSKND